jgi:competence protein ComEC
MIAKHKGEIPVVILLLPFLLGIGLGLNLLQGANLTWLLIAFLILCVVFIVFNLTYNKLKLYKNRWLGGVLITMILFILGWVNVIRYKEINDGEHFSKIPGQFLVVKINNEPVLKNGVFRFTANVEQNVFNGKRLTSSGTLYIAIKDSSARNLYYGEELLIPAKYNAIDPPFNPAEFNYKNYLANQNIFYQSFLYSKQFVVLQTNKGNALIERSLRLRQELVEKFKRNMRDTSAIAVASTLILGYKADLNSDILQAYSKTGTVHVLSVSGAHVAIIYVMLTFVLGFLNRYKYGKLIRSFIIIALVWYYSLLSGFSPAVCRAALMISMVIIGNTFSRYINTLNILALSAFLLLLYNPFFITDVGFQLSYLAVCGLIVFQPVVYQWFKFKNKWADKLWALCSVSIAAQVITFPLSAFYFHQFPVYFLISNLFIVIPTIIIMYAGFAYLLLPQIPLVSKSLAFVLEQTILLMNKGLSIIEHTPYASINKIWITPLEYLLLYVIVISLFYYLDDKKSWLIKMSLVCTLVLCMSITVKKLRQTKTNSIAFLNLKKHKGIVFKNGNKAAVLTDMKADDKAYQYSIQPYLDSCQINNTSVYNMNQGINMPFLLKKHGLVQFLNKRIFIFTGQIKNNLLDKKVNSDYIYITGNPNSELTSINGNFDYGTLIIDGSNNDDLISRLENEAKKDSINYKTLKRNISFISVSNNE